MGAKLARSYLYADLTEAVRGMQFPRNQRSKKYKKFQDELFEKYNYPYIKSILIQDKTIFETFHDQDLFWIASVLIPDKIEDYFSKTEIAKYSKAKYVPEKWNIEPIDCVEVVPGEQWIGMVPDAAEFFKELRMHRMIHYNPDAQRPMTMMKLKNGKSLWTVTVVKSTVEKIKECFNKRIFIPNTITLNIDPDTPDFTPQYDISTHKLILDGLDHFDMIDGFHRYTAICANKDADDNFKYPMEIRITYYPDNKASYFVYQEEQKTPMKKKDAQTLNTESVESKIIARISRESEFKDKIGRNDSIINLSDMTELITVHYVKGQKNLGVSFVKDTADEIVSLLGPFIEEEPISYRKMELLLWLRSEGYSEKEVKKIFKGLNYKEYEKKNEDDYNLWFSHITNKYMKKK